MQVTRAALLIAVLATLPVSADTQKKAPASAQSEAAQKKDDVKRYLQIRESVGAGVANCRRLIGDMKKGSSREIPDAFWMDLAKATTAEALEPVMADVYDRNYSAPELREMIKLIDSPAMKKFFRAESTTVGKALGSALQKYMEEASAGPVKAPLPGEGVGAQKKADIKRYLQLTEGLKHQVESVRHNIEQQKRSLPKDAPASVAASLDRAAKAATPEAFEAVMLGVYDKSYTAPEMHAILQTIDNPSFKAFSYKEKNTVQKDLDLALEKFLSDNSKRLMPKHQAAKAAKVEAKPAPKADAKQN